VCSVRVTLEASSEPWAISQHVIFFITYEWA
jgi:hypothetical protein